MQHSFWQKTRYGVFLLLIFLITIASHPVIVQMSRASGLEEGSILSRYFVLVFAGLFVLCFNIKSLFSDRLIRRSWVMYVFIAIVGLVVLALFETNTMFKELRPLAISLIAIMVGEQMNLNEKQQKIALLLFGLVTTFVALMQILINVGGFVITDQYMTDNKNKLGMMLATSAVIFLLLGLNSTSKKMWRMACLGMPIFILVILLTIRARMATLTMVAMSLYVLYERYKGKNFISYLLIGIIVALIVFLALPQSMKEYVYNSFFQNYEGGDITSGRSSRNLAALDILSDHPLLGNLIAKEYVPWVHNYPLLKMYSFGLVFSFPIMLLYLYLLFRALATTIRADNRNNWNIGYYIFLIPFIVSMAEPTFPYGPGTATVFNFIMFGVARRNTCNEERNK